MKGKEAEEAVERKSPELMAKREAAKAQDRRARFFLEKSDGIGGDIDGCVCFCFGEDFRGGLVFELTEVR